MAAIPWSHYTVKWRASLKTGSWADLDAVHVTELTIGLAPTIDAASLQYKFGTVDGAYREKLDLRGKYVRIQVYDPEDTELYDWVGYVLTEDLARWPEETVGMSQRLRGGEQTFGAVGLEWFLAQETIHHSIIHGGSRIDTVLGFNTGFGDSRDLDYADRGNKDTRSNRFAQDKDHSELWSASDIVKYLIAEHSPRDKDGIREPALWDVDSPAFDDYLDGFVPTVRFDGNSIWQVLNAVIAQTRGLTWWLTYDDATTIATIRVSSIATAEITLPGGGTLTEAAEIITIDNLDGIESHPVVRKDYSRQYDQAICLGAKKRSVFTASFEAGTLEKSWLTSEEDAYKEAASSPHAGTNDIFRQQNRFERIYRAIQIPTSWNGESGTGVNACPKIHPSTGSVIGQEPLHLPSMRLLAVTPLKVGYDYTDATAPVAKDPTNIRSEFLQPFAVIDAGDGDYRFTHKMNANEDVGQRLTSYSFHLLDGIAGIFMLNGGSMPHAIALNSFDESASASDYEPEVDYNTLRCTVCGEWHTHCQGVWPAVTPSSKPLRTLYFSIGDRARSDWLAEETILDVQAGAFVTCTTPGFIRDDRKLCEDYARLAYEWYGVERGTLQINYNRVDMVPNLGALITTVGTGAAQETVNAVVSQISLNLDRGTATMLAGFAELDFESLG